MEMHDLDSALMASLIRDGRASYRAIAREIGLTRNTVARRMRDLQQTGDLAVIAVRHPQVTGAALLVHLSIHIRSAIDPVVEALVAHHQTMLVSTTAGAHNVTVECRLNSQEDLREIWELIRSTGDVVSMSMTTYSKLLRGPYGPPAPEAFESEVDAVDLRILDALADDARTPFVVLAELTGLSATAVRRRVDRLVADSAVRFVPITRRRGPGRFPTLGFGVNGTGDLNELKDRLYGLKSLEYLAQAIGTYDFVGSVVAPTNAELAQALNALCSLEGVSQVRSWLHLAVHKEDYSSYGWTT